MKKNLKPNHITNLDYKCCPINNPNGNPNFDLILDPNRIPTQSQLNPNPIPTQSQS